MTECCSYVQSVLTVFREIRANDVNEFDKLFKSATDMLSSIDGDPISMPRVTAHQNARDNVPANDVVEYYRRSAFVPFLDYLSSELDVRFAKHSEIISSLQFFLPKLCIGISSEKLTNCVQFYHKMLPNSTSLSAEVSLWQMKWRDVAVDKRPSSAVEAFAACNRDLFPIIKVMLRIIATLPVSTATAERSFSTLKRIKSYIRNSTCENRLNGLAMMSVHRDVLINPIDVVQRFALQPRRINFVL